MDRVNALLKKDLSGGSPAQLKIPINLLARELLIAPSEEDWRWLSEYISSLKDCCQHQWSVSAAGDWIDATS